jgi:hypothetical protein
LGVSFVGQMVHHFPYGVSRAPYRTVPASDHHPFSVVVVVISAIAITAAFAMTKPLKAAYGVWLAMLGLSTLSLLAYLVVGAISWGLRGAIGPVCLELSYVLAFVMARRGVDFGKAGAL